jgi:hypothetical protein
MAWSYLDALWRRLTVELDPVPVYWSSVPDNAPVPRARVHGADRSPRPTPGSYEHLVYVHVRASSQAEVYDLLEKTRFVDRWRVSSAERDAAFRLESETMVEEPERNEWRALQIYRATIHDREVLAEMS